MRQRILAALCVIAMATALLGGCKRADQDIKIGVSFGVGAAARWEKEKTYMEEKAQELGIQIEVRLNKTDEPLTQEEDCRELIDSGIDVLILTPRDATKAGDILAYAKEKKVPVINYARVVLGEKVDLLVGYDSTRIGQKQGKYLSELVYEGDYILLRGDEGDNNAALLYAGAMRYISELGDQISILLDAPIPGWSADEAKRMVKEAVAANGGHVDAILCPNDTLAGACNEALQELGVTEHVAITGMDAEVAALQRIAAGTQDITFHMDLRQLAHTAVQEAYHMAKGEPVNVNAEFDNMSGDALIDANLTTGQVITQKNLDSLLIDIGYVTREEVYGPGTSD